ncbi:TetR/AcrR family transcriptional regulator [Streptomyces cacaoi]|uniref:TetR/AcrR family transcriptional regulator n=1 Tax=Streptomyces cacaoi TaxID=1898 RepID=UPI0011F1EAD4|nr:TetR/AcrR family transcriptional regulator [Streptomyces cacaoi]
MAERRRGAALEKALLDAAWEELTEQGYARFTMDAVVKRAGTSPPVLYRRWSDRDALARAALVHRLRELVLPVPDTGSLREDLLTLLREINATRAPLTTTLYAHLAAHHQATGTRPADLTDPVTTGRKQAVDVLFDRAVERGEADPRRLTERARSLPFDLLRQELLSHFAPVEDRVLEEIVDEIFLPLVTPRPG